MADLFTGPYALLIRIGLWLAGILAAVGIGAGLMHHYYDLPRYEILDGQFENFKISTKAAADVMKAKTDAQNLANQRAKAAADEKYQADTATLAADNERLRKLATRGGTVPGAPAASRRPDLACFNRTQLNDAVDDFIADVSRQVASGASAALMLDNARGWAQSLKVLPAPH